MSTSEKKFIPIKVANKGSIKANSTASKNAASSHQTPPPQQKGVGKNVANIPARQPSKIVAATKAAEETLAKLKNEEIIEAARVRGSAEQKVLGGELDWLQFLAPSDTRNIDSCAEIDNYNYSVFQHNNAMLPRVNELLVKLGLPKTRVNPPTKYVPIARQKYEEMLFDENFRVMAGIKYLADRDIFPVKDYEIVESYKKADDIAEKEEVSRLILEAGDLGIDISGSAGKAHAENCTCENRWDGSSERCVGEGVRMRWRRGKDHHFLRARIFPEQF